MNLSTPHDVDGLLKYKGIENVPDPFGAGVYTASDKRPAPNSGLAMQDHKFTISSN